MGWASFTQRELASAIDLHVSQVRRYEAGTSQPTLDVLRKLARTLGVSADLLLFDQEERGPSAQLRLQHEALSSLDPEDQALVVKLVDALIAKRNVARTLENARR